MHYERRLHTFALVKSYIMNEDSTCIHSSSDALQTKTPHICTRKFIHYERGLHMYTLVKSCITNEDSTYTRQVMHYERGLHIHSSSHALRTRTPHTLVKSCITNEDSTYTREVIHYERGIHVESSFIMYDFTSANVWSLRS